MIIDNVDNMMNKLNMNPYIYTQGVSKKLLLTNMVMQKDDIINIIII